MCDTNRQLSLTQYDQDMDIKIEITNDTKREVLLHPSLCQEVFNIASGQFVWIESEEQSAEIIGVGADLHGISHLWLKKEKDVGVSYIVDFEEKMADGRIKLLTEHKDVTNKNLSEIKRKLDESSPLTLENLMSHFNFENDPVTSSFQNLNNNDLPKSTSDDFMSVDVVTFDIKEQQQLYLPDNTDNISSLKSKITEKDSKDFYDSFKKFNYTIPVYYKRQHYQQSIGRLITQKVQIAHNPGESIVHVTFLIDVNKYTTGSKAACELKRSSSEKSTKNAWLKFQVLVKKEGYKEWHALKDVIPLAFRKSIIYRIEISKDIKRASLDSKKETTPNISKSLFDIEPNQELNSTIFLRKYFCVSLASVRYCFRQVPPFGHTMGHYDGMFKLTDHKYPIEDWTPVKINRDDNVARIADTDYTFHFRDQKDKLAFFELLEKQPTVHPNLLRGDCSIQAIVWPQETQEHLYECNHNDKSKAYSVINSDTSSHFCERFKKYGYKIPVFYGKEPPNPIDTKTPLDVKFKVEHYPGDRLLLLTFEVNGVIYFNITSAFIAIQEFYGNKTQTVKKAELWNNFYVCVISESDVPNWHLFQDIVPFAFFRKSMKKSRLSKHHYVEDKKFLIDDFKTLVVKPETCTFGIKNDPKYELFKEISAKNDDLMSNDWLSLYNINATINPFLMKRSCKSNILPKISTPLEFNRSVHEFKEYINLNYVETSDADGLLNIAIMMECEVLINELFDKYFNSHIPYKKSVLEQAIKRPSTSIALHQHILSCNNKSMMYIWLFVHGSVEVLDLLLSQDCNKEQIWALLIYRTCLESPDCVGKIENAKTLNTQISFCPENDFHIVVRLLEPQTHLTQEFLKKLYSLSQQKGRTFFQIFDNIASILPPNSEKMM